MLAFRILTTLLISNGQLVKGKQFKNDRRIGSVQQSINVFKQRGIDEMAIVDIDASKERRLIDYNLVNKLTSECFMPLAFGGGIKSVEDVRLLLENGADKIILGTHTSSLLIKDIALNLGSQSVCVSVDYFENEVYFLSGKNKAEINVFDYCLMVEDSGAGEILLQNIETEGTMKGLDIKTLETICKRVNIPVIASGGAKDYSDFLNAYNAGCSGISVGALYAFTENTPKGAKEFLKLNNVEVRI